MIRDVQLWIDGKHIDLTAAGIRINSVTPWIKDEVSSLTFTQEPIYPIPVDLWINKTVALLIDDGTVTSGYVAPDPSAAITAMPDAPWWKMVFLGQMHRRTANNGDMGWVYGYEALGLDYLASQWPIVSPFDGTGTVTFNLAVTDPNYDAGYADLNLAQMFLLILEEPTTCDHFDKLAKLVDPTDGRYIGAALGNYEYQQIDLTNPARKAWRIDQRTRNDLLNDTYLTQIKSPIPVTFNGDDFLQGIRAILQAVAPNHTMWVEPVYEQPAGAGTPDPKRPMGIIRFADTAKAFNVTNKRNPAKKITMGFDTDPLPQIQRSYQNSFSRVVVRGGPDVQPMILKLSAGELVEDFVVNPYTNNQQAKDAWKLSVWTNTTRRTITGTGLNRRPRINSGTINEVTPTIPDPANPNGTIPNPNYIANITDAKLASGSYFLVQKANETVTLSNGSLSNISSSWGEHMLGQNSNEYAGNITLTRQNPTNGLWTLNEVRTVVDNTEQVAGGTSYMSLSSVLSQTDFQRYSMVLTRWPGLMTWRRYKVNKFLPDGTNVAKRVQASFPAPSVWLDATGGVIATTTVGAGLVKAPGTGNSTVQQMLVGFQTDRQTEHVIIDRPVVTCFGSNANLTTGGNATDGIPSDIQVYLPVSLKALEVAIPDDTVTANAIDPNLPTITPNYQGTSFTEDGLKRTKFVNDLQWVSGVDKDVVKQWGAQLLAGIQDTLVEGQATKLGYAPLIGSGYWLEWTDPCRSDGLDRLTTDIRGCTITWNHGSSVVPIHTQYTLSNRRDPYASQTPIVYHPCQYPAAPRGEYKIEYGSGSLAYTKSDSISKYTTDLDNQITAVQTNLGVNIDTFAAASEVGRLQAAGLTPTANQFGLQAAYQSGVEADNATRNAVAAAAAGTLEGDGQGWSGNYHTAGGDIETGYGMDGKSYKPGGAE